MGRSLVSAFFLLLAGVQAVPGSLDLRCHHDKCYREAKACGRFPGPASASQDCSSFLEVTVTVCPNPAYTTTTVTATAEPVSTYITNVVTIQPTITTIDVVSSVTTVPDTISQFTTLVLTSTDVEYTAVTVTATVTTTSTPQVTITISDKKRDLATEVPSYASACSDPAQYESACSCNGVVGSTSTVTETNFTITVTDTTTTTATVVVSTTVTESLPTTLVETSVVPLTATAFTTVLDVVSTTVVHTVVVPTTATVTVDMPPAACTTFAMYANTSPESGYLTYFEGQLDIGSPTQAQPFVYDTSSGMIYQAGTSNFLATSASSGPNDVAAPAELTSDPGADALLCEASGRGALADGVSFECANTQFNVMCICQSNSDLVLVLTQGDCSALFLCAAVTVSSVFNQC